MVAASIDTGEKAQEVANDISFPLGQGVTREDADKIGAWWEDRRSIIQPSEFIIGPEGKIVVASYSDGPLGRIDPADVIKLVKFYESRK